MAVFEDLAANMAVLRRRVEEQQRVRRRAARLMEEGSAEEASALLGRATSRELRENLSVLCAEIEKEFGDLGRMPMREALRERGRTDIERAIRAHGGSRAVARAMGWEAGQRRKPKGYW